MFENVDGRTDGRRTDNRVIGILKAHLGAFGSGELKRTLRKDYSLYKLNKSNVGLVCALTTEPIVSPLTVSFSPIKGKCG